MIRLDRLLVDRGLFATRSRARDAILRGAVRVENRIAGKPGQLVDLSVAVEIEDPAAGYVSRAALKLLAALNRLNLDPAGRIALDIGASTGGFTQILLERGAARVFALDVGHGQLDPSLAADSRVSLLEGLNARDLTLADLGNLRPDFLVGDVSFISLRLALPPALALASPGSRAVFLVKPQFEAGRSAIGKGGILRDPESGAQIAAGIADWLHREQGWSVLGLIESPIAGGDGNREYLIGAEKPQ